MKCYLSGSRQDGWLYYYHAECDRSVWAEPIKDTDHNMDAIYKEIDKFMAECC